MRLNYFKAILGGLLFVSGNLMAQDNKNSKFIDSSNMDLTVKPGDDFYMYANGNWVKNNPVPAKETRWGSFNVLRDFNINVVKTLLEQAAKNNRTLPGSVERKVGDFYRAGMDSVIIEKLGYSPIKNELKKLGKIKTLQQVLEHSAALRTSGAAAPLFSFYVAQDRKNVNEMAPHLSQGGITLPDRDYYLKDSERNINVRQAYSTYITQLFTLTGASDHAAKKNAEIIYKIEKGLAKAQLSRVELRDPLKTYNKYQLVDFNRTTPDINWNSLLAIMKASGQDSILVTTPTFFADLNNTLKLVPVEEWKVYLQWNVLKNAAAYLSTPFVEANFAFNQALTGQKVQTPRWQRVSSATDASIGELLGQLYVKEYFKPEAKARMQELVENLRKAFEIRIKNLEWMSANTKEKALAKLHAFTPKIGYPDKWKTYDGLEIKENTFFENLRQASIWSYNDMIDRLGKPVDRTRWGMTPPTVNAYYSPVMNEIVFPAGILQFPFFDPNADDAINYGGIGAVIGHEMSHGFDDSGSQYDKDGSLRNWWTAEDESKFKVKSKTLVEQFNNYTVLDTIAVNGKLTLGENIGDLGGLNAAYEAFKMTKQGQSNGLIDGFTPDQRFFLSWAQVWRGNILPETAAQYILTDPHSPGEYRTIGAPVNMDAWYDAFDVKPGDKLYKKPEDRIRIW